MGNKPSQQINPNDYSTKNQQTTQAGKEQLHTDLIQKCHQEAIEGCLTYDRFNNVLNVLEIYNVIVLRKTPLAKRLFNGLDSNRSGKVHVSRILAVLENLLSGSEEWALKCNLMRFLFIIRRKKD